jgi:hypothetical protein
MSIVVGFTCKISSKSEILNQLLKVKSNRKDLCCWSAVGGHVTGRKFSSVKVGFWENIVHIRATVQSPCLSRPILSLSGICKVMKFY